MVLPSANPTLNPARRGYRQAAGGTSRSICTSEGRRSSYGGREEEEAEGEGGRRGRWRETAQEQEEKDESQRRERLVSAFALPSRLILRLYPVFFLTGEVGGGTVEAIGFRS